MVCVGVHRSSEHTSLHPGKESQLPHRGDPAVITTYPANTPREREGGGGGTARDSRDHRLPRGSVIRLRERRDGATGELYHLPFPAEKRQFGASLLYPASHNTH